MKFSLDVYQRVILLKKGILSVLLLSIFISFPTSAATVMTQPSEIRLGVGQEMLLDVILRPEGEDVNALEGSIVVPQALEVTQIRDQDSLVSLWIERPQVNNGRVTFSGVIPGGYRYPHAKVFSVVVRAKEASEGGVLVLEGWRVLRNDGQGSAISLSLSPPPIHIAADTMPSVPPVASLVDTEAPEPFTIQLTQDPNVFDGQWFIVFSTLDKGSGIDYYDVREELYGKGEWVRAESPYVLKDQSRTRTISVRAVDRVGNERISVMRAPIAPPPVPVSPYLLWIILAILFLSIGFVIARRVRARDRR